MPKKFRLYLSFAVADQHIARCFINEARFYRSPYEHVYMPLDDPFDDDWKAACRLRLTRCDGVLAFYSTKTLSDDRPKYEVKIAKEEQVPVMKISVSWDRPAWEIPTPKEYQDLMPRSWSREAIQHFLDGQSQLIADYGD